MYVPRRDDAALHQDQEDRDAGTEFLFEDYEDQDDHFEQPLELVRSQSNIQRIQSASELYHAHAANIIHRLHMAQDPNIIDRDILAKVIHQHQERFYGCLSLPFSLAFFGFFAFSAFLHEDISNVYMIESGLRKVLGHNLKKVDDIPGMYRWMRFDTLVPELFNQDVANKTFWSRVLVYNQLQGPLLIEQSRSEKKTCVYDLIADSTCYPSASVSTTSYGRNVTPTLGIPSSGEYSGGNVTLQQREAYYASAFAPFDSHNWRRLRSMRTEYMNYLPSGSSAPDDKFKVFIYPNTPRAQIDEHFGYLYQKGWLDIQTKEVVLKALLLNAEVGRPRLEQLQVSFRFSRGGGIFSRLTMESLFLEFSADMMSLGTDAMWLLCLMTMTFTEIRRVCRVCRQVGCRKAFTRLWTILQWAIISGGWALVLCYLYQHNQRMKVAEKLEDVIKTQKTDIPADVNHMGQELFEAISEMLAFSGWFRIYLAYYHLLCMFRFFTAFHAQPRLGVVTSTLQSSVVDIAHFLVVLLPTFMAYAVSGCFIFGRRMEAFATFDSAIGICFKMALEGEYDWPELSTEHFWTACLWTWSFMLLMVLLMLNMVLAIIMDVYQEMRNHAGQSETVYQTVKNLIGRLWNWRRWVSNEHIEEKLPDMREWVSREDLLTEFPNMTDRQLNALIHACNNERDNSAAEEQTGTLRMTLASKLAIDQIHEEIDQLYQAYDAAVNPPTDHVPTIDRAEPSRGWLQHISKQMAAQNHFMLTAQWQLQQLQWKWQAIDALHGTNIGVVKEEEFKSKRTSVTL